MPFFRIVLTIPVFWLVALSAKTREVNGNSEEITAITVRTRGHGFFMDYVLLNNNYAHVLGLVKKSGLKSCLKGVTDCNPLHFPGKGARIELQKGRTL
jgi:hypothetical protein